MDHGGDGVVKSAPEEVLKKDLQRIGVEQLELGPIARANSYRQAPANIRYYSSSLLLVPLRDGTGQKKRGRRGSEGQLVVTGGD